MSSVRYDIEFQNDGVDSSLTGIGVMLYSTEAESRKYNVERLAPR